MLHTCSTGPGLEDLELPSESLCVAARQPSEAQRMCSCYSRVLATRIYICALCVHSHPQSYSTTTRTVYNNLISQLELLGAPFSADITGIRGAYQNTTFDVPTRWLLPASASAFDARCAKADMDAALADGCLLLGACRPKGGAFQRQRAARAAGAPALLSGQECARPWLGSGLIGAKLECQRGFPGSLAMGSTCMQHHQGAGKTPHPCPRVRRQTQCQLHNRLRRRPRARGRLGAVQADQQR